MKKNYVGVGESIANCDKWTELALSLCSRVRELEEELVAENSIITGQAIEIKELVSRISHLERIEAAARMFMRYYWTASTEDNGRERQELTEALNQALGGRE